MDGGQAQRQSQLSEQLDNLERATKRYEELVARAENRYGSITRAQEPVATLEKTGAPPPPIVPVADRLRGIVGTINMISTRFESIIERAEN